MSNSYQLKTQKGKPIINNNKLPIYSLPINLRLNNIKKQLGLNNKLTHNERWDKIKNDINNLIIK